jgi:hypothetical protein
VLEDLQAPLQQHFEELRVTDPRLYFRVMQQQQQQSPVKQPPQQQQQQDVVQRLRGVDPLGLLDPPMASAAAKQVSCCSSLLHHLMMLLHLILVGHLQFVSQQPVTFHNLADAAGAGRGSCWNLVTYQCRIIKSVLLLLLLLHPA